LDDDVTRGDLDTGDEPSETPRRIGRYIVIARVGAGAMGVVYAAFDPELSRKLAIKVLHATDEPETARQRLAREAQALARLSHPNVVQIYDVGTHERAVWVAMEFVDGETLRQWTATPRTWREIIAVLRDVGRGLAAAHRTGIVHRDVKPDNVLIGAPAPGDTMPTVRVVDFGLARAAMEGPVSDDAIRSVPTVKTPLDGLPEAEIVSDSLGERMTRTGARLGTPAYMAPEQWTGAPVEARTDQFAFCVMAWEALYGERPFRADNLAMLGVAITQGQLAAPPATTNVPAWIHRLLARGLQPEPAQRHADMDTLLAALGRDPAQARQRWLVGGLAVGVTAGAVGIGASLASEPPKDPCAAATTALDGVWDDARRRVVADALGATKRSYADETSARVDASLTRWADRFVAARRDACEATQVRAEQSAEAMDLRIACLDRGRAALGALVDVLAHADADVLDGAVRASEALPDPDECADLERLRDAALRPEDPALRDEAAAIRDALAKVRALRQAARAKDAAAALVDPLARATALGWAPLVAEAHELDGGIALDRGEAAAAITQLETAYLAAIEGRHDRAAWSTLVSLAQAQAQLGDQAAAARRTAALARAHWAHARLGDRELALVENAAFRVEAAAGDYAAARGHIEKAIALRDTGEESADLAGGLANLGAIAWMTGDVELATAKLRRAIAIRERVQAPGHPDVGRDLHNLGSMLAQSGKYDDATPLLERALVIKREVLGDEHPDVAYTLVSLANVAVSRRQLEDAERHIREALAIQEKALGADHPDVAFSLLTLGDRFVVDGRPKDALPHLRRALENRERAQGPEHPEVAPVLYALGVAELDTGDPRAATEHLARAHAAQVKLGDPYERARSAFALARARWAATRDPAAPALAETARADFRSLTPPDAEGIANVDAWLSSIKGG
jgi:tetratricopeptide (TPR) repeat protein